MSDDGDSVNVCHACIGDEYLKEEVRTCGEKGDCYFCGSSQNCISLDELADRIHDVLEEHFYLTSSEPEGLDYLLAKEGMWEQPGESVDSVIAEIAQVEEEVAKAVQEHLSELHGYVEVRDGGEDPYADDALYEGKGPDCWGFQETWNFFISEITTRSRFFSKHGQQALDEIFDEIDVLKAFGEKSVIREISPNDSERYLYRGRIAFSDTELRKILSTPSEQLGPPPHRKARAGRMNPSGISVLYGAMDEDTCIAEARAPVGSYVVTGKLEIIRPIRLLDFNILMNAYVVGSHFDPDFHTRRGRATFLGRLVQEISQPVMPRDEEFEYLPTQAVSEYLSEHMEPRLDGIMYHSSQTAGKGRNIVLFNHACCVEPYELPDGTDIELNMGWVSEDDYDDSISIFECVPSKAEESNEEKSEHEFTGIEFGSDFMDPEEMIVHSVPNEPTLRLDIDSTNVVHVEGVEYKTATRSVSRYRTQNDKSRKF